MKFTLILFITTFFSFSITFGQKKVVSSGEVVFHAIEKRTFSAKSIVIQGGIDFSTNTVSIIIPVNSFEYTNKEEEKEFNQKENLNSETYPNLLINGEISSNSDASKEGRHIISFTGDFTLKGVTHSLNTKGLLVNKAGKTYLNFSFLIDGRQYNLKSEAYKDFIDKLEFSIALVY